MHRDLVERRGWISESGYRDGLAVAASTLDLEGIVAKRKADPYAVGVPG